ncbi:MAG: hypothetical protein HQL23_04230 [Candidatus Omnitrophica bacterium]|nr:hypothetical protein [Candidatus Omnitrophota bacterium]
MKNFHNALILGLGAIMLLSANVFAAVVNDKYPEIQKIIDSAIANDPQITGFCIYAILSGQSKLIRIASDDPAIIGAVGDPEDLKAMQNDKVITLWEKDSVGEPIVDITYPINVRGQPVAVAGIKFRQIKDKSVSENMAIADAKAKIIIQELIEKINAAAKPLW